MKDKVKAAGNSWSRRSVFAISVIIFLCVQHYLYSTRPELLASEPEIVRSTSIRYPSLYDYGLYYWGLLPAYSSLVLNRHRDLSLFNRQEAALILRDHGESLRMEYVRTLRCGERMVKVMKWPLMLIRGTPYKASHHTVISFLFISSLILLTLALCRYAPAPLFIFLPVFLSSSGFLAGSVYYKRVTLGLLPIGVIFAIALFCPLIFGKSVRTGSVIIRALIFSALMVVLVNIRSPAMAAMVSPAIALALYPRFKIWNRLAMIAVLLASFVAFEKLFDYWWNYNYDRTSRILEKVGGTPFKGPRISRMPFWHSIWCGLADFDDQLGYQWRDAQAFRYGLPILKERGYFPEEDIMETGYFGGIYSGLYPWDIPEYDGIIRARIVSDIRENPGWYADILFRRAKRILLENEPPGFLFGNFRLRIPATILFYLLALAAVPAIGPRPYATLALSVLPSAAVAFFCTTFGGQQFKSILHIVLLALLATAIFRWLEYGIRRGRAVARARLEKNRGSR